MGGGFSVEDKRLSNFLAYPPPFSYSNNMKNRGSWMFPPVEQGEREGGKEDG